MKQIIKGPEPASLTQHRQTAHANFGNYLDKETLRQQLISEQRGICCYCMGRLRPDGQSMKIEHWRSQGHYPDQQLDYSNLLGACLGNKGQRPTSQHCDTRKGEQDLSRNPANPTHDIESLIRFQGDGTIISDNPLFNAELNEVLNLNEGRLRNNRKAVLDAFHRTLCKWGSLQRHTLENLLADWNGDSHNGDLREYCQIVVYWLRKRLRRI
jgi:uncharacterized protein (TIGR02646 family)